MTNIDTTRYLRAHLVISDVFTNILRTFVITKVMCIQSFQTMLQCKDFQKFLQKSEKEMIDEIINAVNPFEKLDITISYKIIRFFNYTQPPSRGWGSIPAADDLLVSDDIERIRIARNAVVHKPRPELTESEMKSVFTNYSEISQRFDKFFNYDSDSGYYKSVKDYGNKTIDPEMEEEYKEKICRLEEKCSMLTGNRQKVTIYFDKDINDMFSASTLSECRLKIHLVGVKDSEKIRNVLSSISSKMVDEQNCDIVLDNVGVGSIVLYVTTKDKSMINENVFMETLKQFVCYTIEIGHIQFQCSEKADVVVLISDPYLDYDQHKIFDAFDAFDFIGSEPLFEQETEKEKKLSESTDVIAARRDQEPPNEDLLQGSADDMTAQVVLTQTELELLIKQRGNNFLKNEIRIVLIGKTGVGKSSTGNTVLGDNVFTVGHGMATVTHRCAVREKTINRRQILVVDTPGIFVTERDEEELENEIKECIKLTAPGPHAILFVINLNDKFKNEDYDAFITFVQYFGSGIFEHVIAVFTHADILKKKQKTLDEYLHENAPPLLHCLLKHLGNRKIAFDNDNPGFGNHQVENLFTIIEAIREGKKNTSYYRNETYDFAERNMIEIEKPLDSLEGTFYKVVNQVIEKRKEDEVRKIEMRLDSELYRLRQQTRRTVPSRNIFTSGITIKPNREQVERKLKEEPETRCMLLE